MDPTLIIGIVIGVILGAFITGLDDRNRNKRTPDELQAFRDGCEYERRRILALVPNRPAWIRERLEQKIRDPEGTDHE